MSTQLPFLCNGDDSFAVISACYTLTEQYRNILIDLGKEHQLSENEMLVLVHLAQYPEACTQKKLQGTHLQLRLESIFQGIPGFDVRGFANAMVQAAAVADETAFSA